MCLGVRGGDLQIKVAGIKQRFVISVCKLALRLPSIKMGGGWGLGAIKSS